MIDKELRDHMRFIVERLGDAASDNNPTLVMFHAGQLVALMGQSGILEEPVAAENLAGRQQMAGSTDSNFSTSCLGQNTPISDGPHGWRFAK